MRSRFISAILFILFFMLCLTSCGGRGNDNNATSGSLDAAFATNGMLKVQVVGTTFDHTGIVIQPDGKILVPGTYLDGSNYKYAILRLNPDGNPDQQFGTNGKAIITSSSSSTGGFIRKIAVQTDGKIIVVGQPHDHVNYIDVIRLFPDGTRDTGWGNPGQQISLNGTDGTPYGVAIQDDGKVIVVGTTPNGPDTDFLIVRINTDGSFDNTFGNSGIVKTSVRLGAAQQYLAVAQHVSIQNNGKIIIAGTVDVVYQSSAQYYSVLARYNSDGSLDASFGNSGLIADALGFLTGLVIQQDGKICISVYQGSGIIDNQIIRYSSQGILDQTFAQNGALDTFPIIISSLIQDSQGRLLVIGDHWQNNNVVIARYQNNGSIDSSFGANGGLISGAIDYGATIGLAVQGNGRIVAAGSTNNPIAGTLSVLKYFP